MFRFMLRFGRNSQARSRGTGPFYRVRRRNHQLKCEDLESRQLLSGYYIMNAASGDALDDPGGSTSYGTTIDQWQLNGGANFQRWDLVAVGNGNYFIQNRGQPACARQLPLHRRWDPHRSVVFVGLPPVFWSTPNGRPLGRAKYEHVRSSFYFECYPSCHRPR